MINQAIACIKQHIINSFTVDSNNMLYIATGQAATATTKTFMDTAEQIDKIELQKCLNDNSKKVQKCIHIFEEQHTIHRQAAPQKQK